MKRKGSPSTPRKTEEEIKKGKEEEYERERKRERAVRDASAHEGSWQNTRARKKENGEERKGNRRWRMTMAKRVGGKKTRSGNGVEDREIESVFPWEIGFHGM